MGCPDPTPPPGSVEDLEYQKRELERRITAKRNADYLASGRFDADLLDLYKAVTSGSKPDENASIEAILKFCAKEARKTTLAYTDTLWGR